MRQLPLTSFKKHKKCCAIKDDVKPTDPIVEEINKPAQYNHIVVALDGSEDSMAGGQLAIEIAEQFGSRISAVHVYDTKIHLSRFREMEPGLPARYRAPEYMGRLRSEHDSLMNNGFKTLSLGYMEQFLGQAREKGITVTEAPIEGRNYIALLELLKNEDFDLAVLGATGLGAQSDNMLGSTALRVLRRADCDILIARKRVNDKTPGPVVAGIDGSDNAHAAARLAETTAKALAAKLQLFAAYDVAFHRTIFKTMAHSLSAARQQQIGLDRQEAVHEELIDNSLKSLYGSFLKDVAVGLATPETDLLCTLRPGKAYRALVDYSEEILADLIVVGRYGHNREPLADIGSHAEAVVRLARCHVLVCAATGTAETTTKQTPAEIDWDEEPLQRLERIPGTVRPMAKQAIEQQALTAGETKVTLAVFEKAAEKFGMR